MSYKTDITKYRKTEYEADDIFINRWSPRAMSGEEVTNDELFSLFEAARWAPSSFNNQPWRFVYAKKNTDYLLKQKSRVLIPSSRLFKERANLYPTGLD